MKNIDINAASKEGTPLYLLIAYQESYFDISSIDTSKSLSPNENEGNNNQNYIFKILAKTL